MAKRVEQSGEWHADNLEQKAAELANSYMKEGLSYDEIIEKVHDTINTSHRNQKEQEQTIVSAGLKTRYLKALWSIRAGKRPLLDEELVDTLCLFENDDVVSFEVWKNVRNNTVS